MIPKPLLRANFIIRYDAMKTCWEMVPDHRPTFAEVVTLLSAHLGLMAGYIQISGPFSPHP
jgi:hypothetical protein